MTTAIEELRIGNGIGDELTVTMRGKAEEIVKVLVGGVGHDGLVQIKDAIESELQRRRDEAHSATEQ